jgi:hypothetical protein
MADLLELIGSELDCEILCEGEAIQVRIYKCEDDEGWSLELEDDKGTSVVSDDQYASEPDALADAVLILKQDGLALFKEGIVDDLPPKGKMN